MRTIKHIVIHCTATSPKTKVSSIQNYWKRHLGWRMPGYHFIVLPNGNFERLLDVSQVSNGVKGYNAHAIHISYIGGVSQKGNPLDTRTQAQKATLLQLIKLCKTRHPNAEILGHRDFPGVRKACPSFDAKNEYKHL